MHIKYCLPLITLWTLFFLGCGQPGHAPTPTAPAGPTPTEKVFCPASHFSKPQLQALVAAVMAVHDENVVGTNADWNLRAGFLASFLSQSGTDDASLMQSFANGKFAAMASWFWSDRIEVDLEKFKNCEGY